jgi:hypothetical protein
MDAADSAVLGAVEHTLLHRAILRRALDRL